MWIAISVLLCIALIISFTYHIIYRRQVEGLCRQTAFLNENKTELKIGMDLNAKELKELAEEIQKLSDNFNKTKVELYRQDEALRETIANLSHDIRTPLTSLDGYFQLLASENLTAEKKQQYLTIIKSRIVSLNDMLNELFTYAKLQDVNYHIELGSLDIVPITADTLVSFYDDIAAMGDEPIIELPEEPVMIQGNREAYTRAVQNIIKNALMHGKKLQVSLKEIDGHAVFSCSDELLNPDTKIDTSRIFDRFYKADAARNTKGSGLGLAITRELVERMGGKSEANVENGRFEIRLIF
ncbi:MAG: HAMP domain-containing histidine kinase [Lachnospiraceae bacterium]|nr:HAMP domain-containing histidine kinase [Lachnospiraceae bacterium]